MPSALQANKCTAAAASFARVAESPLSFRIFVPFREEARSSPEVAQVLWNRAADREAERWARFISVDHSRPLGLGEMIQELSLRKNPISRRFHDWLKSNHKRLLDKRWALGLETISDLRNRPAHPGGVVSCEEAERMYSLCCRFLDVLIEG